MNSAPQKELDRQSEQQITLLSAKVSEPAEANDTLVTTQILVEAMLENIPDRIYFKDAQSRFIRISKALAKRLGVASPEDAVGKTDFDFHGPEKAREFFADEQRIIQTGYSLINKIEKQTLPNGETA